MRHGSLFSGIGGFDLAAEWMGWQNVFHCEWNEFGQNVLKHYWPDAELFTDITKSDFKKYHGTIDIISGGFPCQPYSAAGKRLGKEDDRHLWPEMLRAIREIQPRWVVGENVLGLVNWSGGLVFDEVQTDLEAAGYEVQPYVLPAASVGAPHRRDRIWFVAYSKSAGAGSDIGGVRSVFNGYNKRKEDESLAADTNDPGTNICMSSEREREESDIAGGFARFEPWKIGRDGDVADTDSDGFNQRNGKHEEQSSEGGQYALGNFNESNDDGNAADTNAKRLQCERRSAGMGRERFGINNSQNNRPTWENFPTVSPICHGNDGISNRLDGITFPKWRNESIKAAGNAIVPQVVYQIFKAIEQYEQLP